jgi:branched-chain amino acid transport system substrate-binding protein
MRRAALLLLLACPPLGARAAEPNIPVLVPLTGFLAVEGKSQRNGAELALAHPPGGLRVRHDVSDTGTSPEVAVNAFERAAGEDGTIAVVTPMLGTQMLALLPVALEQHIPMLTISGTAAITQKGNPWVFRFFPDDQVTKSAQVRFAVEEKGIKRPALITQTTAYGQSGREEILRLLKERGIAPVYEDALDVSVRDMTPVLAKVRASGADSLLLHLHGGPTALLLKAASGMGLGLPIIAGSGLSQPSTLALLEPAEIKGACAETAASPVSAETPAMRDFVATYRQAFGAAPDAFALTQDDGTTLALDAIARGASTPEQLRAALDAGSYQGLAMTYKSDGHGNMAHDAVIICFDGTSRTPSVAKHYGS